MSILGEIERKTQNRIVKLFQEKLGYQYLGNWQTRENNHNVEVEYLTKFLNMKGYSNELIKRAINQLINVAKNNSENLYNVNHEIYTMLRYGIKVKENVGENFQTVELIDWKNPLDNDFYIAEEVSIKGEHKKRPDIVIYVNGIALGVVELKRSTVNVNEGIRQNIDNQKGIFIKPFFNTMQLIMAGNNTEGLRYGTIETSEKYYLRWKEDNKADDEVSIMVQSMIIDDDYPLDKELIGLCNKKRFLEIIHDFIVFDSGIKKLCRKNQYFGVKASQKRIKKREGGIIWHTQGSGKSLIMVWLAKWIKENLSEARVLIITDREELDQQIEKVFIGVDENIKRANSGRDLIEILNQKTPRLICSLIHKFGHKNGNDIDREMDYEDYIKEIKDNLPADFMAKGDIFVFVDECHRTQSGDLHRAMKTVLPNALFIGFTGTPLLKSDKQRSIEVFGSYIHTYKFDEAVKDKVIIDLRYEARKIDQDITSQEKIDEWFEIKTKGLTDVAKMKLKQRWGTMQSVLSSKSRLEIIAQDVYYDMNTKNRLMNGKGNALLVANSIYEACKYYEIFQNLGLKKCAIITSYVPTINDIRGEATGEDRETEYIEKYEIYNKMLGGKNVEDFEKEVKKMFVETPAQMKLLIVVDKLLTGFDAPPATYLYIDKPMQDHGLFQAICRVNRLDGDDKEYGYIIDYKDLFKSLEKAVEDYTSEAFENFNEEDVKGLLTKRLDKAKERLDAALEGLDSLCEPVEMPKDTINYMHYFVAKDTTDLEAIKNTEPKRKMLYKLTASLSRAYADIANEMIEAGYTSSEAQNIIKEVKKYETIRKEIMLAAGDFIDLKAYEGDMRYLIDTYIKAEDSQIISTFDNLTLLDLLVAKGLTAIDDLPENIKKNRETVAETIENNVRRLIIDESITNPRYYENMSKLLDELIKKRKEEVIEYEKYLKELLDLARKVKDPGKSERYPSTINSSARRALYDNLDEDEGLVLDIDDDIIRSKPDGWRNHRIKERQVKLAIKRHIDDTEEIKRIFEIVKAQEEY